MSDVELRLCDCGHVSLLRVWTVLEGTPVRVWHYRPKRNEQVDHHPSGCKKVVSDE